MKEERLLEGGLGIVWLVMELCSDKNLVLSSVRKLKISSVSLCTVLSIHFAISFSWR